MNKSIISSALLVAAFNVSAQSAPEVKPVEDKEVQSSGPMSYPGNMWGTTVLAPDAPAGYPKYRIEGVIEQGADWFRFGTNQKWKFNTYVAAEYVINSDSHGVSPVIGMKISRGFEDGNLDLGLRYKHGSTYLSPTGASNPGGTKSVGRVELFATYWFAWNLKK